MVGMEAKGYLGRRVLRHKNSTSMGELMGVMRGGTGGGTSERGGVRGGKVIPEINTMKLL